jgi:hypothetical protein
MERQKTRRDWHIALIYEGLKSPKSAHRNAIEHRLLPILFKNTSISSWIVQRFSPIHGRSLFRTLFKAFR